MGVISVSFRRREGHDYDSHFLLPNIFRCFFWVLGVVAASESLDSAFDCFFFIFSPPFLSPLITDNCVLRLSHYYYYFFRLVFTVPFFLFSINFSTFNLIWRGGWRSGSNFCSVFFLSRSVWRRSAIVFYWFTFHLILLWLYAYNFFFLFLSPCPLLLQVLKYIHTYLRL